MPEANIFDTTGDEDETPDDGLLPLDDPGVDTRHEVEVTETIITAELPAEPLRLPSRLLNEPPDTEAALSLERLRGFALSVDWLPENLSPELDVIRERHLDLLGQLGERLATVNDLERRFRREDHAHQQAVREALRTGSEVPPDDTTNLGTRYEVLGAAGELVWPLIVILAEVVEAAVLALRQNEAEILGRLSAELAEASDKRREAEALVAEARQAEWMIDRVGRWVIGTADGGPMSRQPRPKPETPSKYFQPGAISLQRSWAQAPVA